MDRQSIRFSSNSRGMIVVRTDKPIYKPSQTRMYIMTCVRYLLLSWVTELVKKYATESSISYVNQPLSVYAIDKVIEWWCMWEAIPAVKLKC